MGLLTMGQPTFYAQPLEGLGLAHKTIDRDFRERQRAVLINQAVIPPKPNKNLGAAVLMFNVGEPGLLLPKGQGRQKPGSLPFISVYSCRIGREAWLMLMAEGVTTVILSAN